MTESAATESAATESRLTRRQLIGYAAAGVLGALFLAGAIFFGLRVHSDHLTDQARSDAPAAAGTQAKAMLSYDYGHAKQQLDAAAGGLTGDFRTVFQNLVDNTLVKGAQEKQITVKADVQAASVETASPDKATVLLFINQFTTSKDNPQAVINPSRVEMQMRKVDGRWLAASMNPV
jgi:Mce-associated membrane protein